MRRAVRAHAKSGRAGGAENGHPREPNVSFAPVADVQVGGI